MIYFCVEVLWPQEPWPAPNWWLVLIALVPNRFFLKKYILIIIITLLLGKLPPRRVLWAGIIDHLTQMGWELRVQLGISRNTPAFLLTSPAASPSFWPSLFAYLIFKQFSMLKHLCSCAKQTMDTQLCERSLCATAHVDQQDFQKVKVSGVV